MKAGSTWVTAIKLSCLEGKGLMLATCGRNHHLSLAQLLANAQVFRSTFAPNHYVSQDLGCSAVCMYLYVSHLCVNLTTLRIGCNAHCTDQ